MAATSYSTLPSDTHTNLGSQGDLLHAAHYGTYDSGIGSLTSNPYQYPTSNYRTHFIDNQQQPSYSNDYLHTTYANEDTLPHEPQYYPSDRYSQQPTYDQDTLLNNYHYPQRPKYNDRSTISNNIDEQYGVAAASTTNTIQPPYRTTMDNHSDESNNNHHQISNALTTQYQPSISSDNQYNQSQSLPKSNPVRSEQHNNSNRPPKSHPTTQHPLASNNGHVNPSESTTKTTNPVIDMKTTKSSKMRAAAIKQKEEIREQKQKNGSFPTSKKKATPPKSIKSQRPHRSDAEQNNKEKPKRNKKQSHSVPQARKSRRDGYRTDDNNSSDDDDNRSRRSRSKSKKRTPLSDSHSEKYPSLPPVRRGRGPPFYDPIYDYPFPGHPLRGRHPYYDDFPFYGPYPYPSRYDYRHRYLYDDGCDTPPYLPPSHGPYDRFFDYEKRKSKSKSKVHNSKREMNTDYEGYGGMTGNETEHEDDAKSQQSKKSKVRKTKNKNIINDNEKQIQDYFESYYQDRREMLELWRQERNDYLKNKYKPTVHDVLYSQQWMKTDSYLENQRRRALRDIQGYYFPYKKYTLKDYKDLQKMDAQNNPYASISDTVSDRKDRAKKRQEYGLQVEKQASDSFSGQTKTPRDMQSKKPWHITHEELRDPEKSSKRERALQYAKVQVVKHRPTRPTNERSNPSDPTEQYINSLFPETMDDDDDEDPEN